MTQHNRDKYPEIWAAFERAKTRKAQLMAERQPYVAKMNEIHNQRELLQAELDSLAGFAYKDIEELREVSKEISKLARAMGGKSIAAPLNSRLGAVVPRRRHYE